MRRSLVLTVLSCSLAACGDDTSESLTTITGDTDEDGDDDDDDDDDDDATFGEGPFEEEGPFDESDTFEESGPFEEEGPFDESGPFEESDTFDESGPFEESDSFEESSEVSDTFETTETTVTDSDPTTTDATDSATTTTTDATDSATTTSTDTDATTTGDTDATTTGDTDTDTDTGGGGFPAPEAFGDDVQELDLVGAWNLNWDPENGFDSVLDIDATGDFIWTESSADCSSSTMATGFLWVDNGQIVLHVETWERPLPWDTAPVTGETYEPPFRLRMSFSLQGGLATGYLTLAAPGTITATEPYTGESYVRLSTDGSYLGGTWHGEAELFAIPAGASDPVVIVRDTYEAILQPEADVLNPEGVGVRHTNTQYFPVPQQSDTFAGGNWTCLNGCPPGSGATLIDGSNLYAYGPYAGQQHLLTFSDGRTFRNDIDSDCF